MEKERAFDFYLTTNRSASGDYKAARSRIRMVTIMHWKKYEATMMRAISARFGYKQTTTITYPSAFSTGRDGRLAAPVKLQP